MLVKCVSSALLLIVHLIGPCTPELVVKGFCGDPGTPERAKLSPQKDPSVYDEDDSVVYECNDFISIKQYRKCVRGKWRGESAVCGKSFKDNDVVWARVYDKITNDVIEEYNTSQLMPFPKFANSFIAERYAQPLRAFGSKSYRIELTLQRPAVFHLVRISLSVVNHLIEDKIKRSKLEITKVTAGPYRKCRVIRQSSVSPWLHNSTRFDYWYNCESIDDNNYRKELKNKTNLIAIETNSTSVLNLDLATFILTEQYHNEVEPYEPICGVPEVPVGLEKHVINHNSKYAFKCAQGFKDMDGEETAIPRNTLTCVTDMKWSGSLPTCMPTTTCKKFDLSSQRHLTEVIQYEKVYYLNDSVWFAIEGTKAHFRCKDETQIFIGKDTRVCGKDGDWSDSLPNCLETDNESKLDLTSIAIIIMVTLILTFGLSALLVFCVLRMKRSRNEKLNQSVRQSNIYDDYDLAGLDSTLAKNIEYENYETVDEDRYAAGQMRPPPDQGYAVMTGGAYKYNYKDKNVYDDCALDYQTAHYERPNGGPDDSYVVMKVK